MESERFVVRRKERDERSTGQPNFSIAVAQPGLVGILWGSVVGLGAPGAHMGPVDRAGDF